MIRFMKYALCFTAVLLVAACAPVAACEQVSPMPEGVSIAGMVTFARGAEPTEGPTLFVNVRNEGPADATFDLVLVDKVEGRGIARSRVEALPTGCSRTITFRTDLDSARLHAIAIGAHDRKPCPKKTAASRPPAREMPASSRLPSRGDDAIAFGIEATAVTGCAPGGTRDAWHGARGEVRVTPIGAKATRFEVRATGLRPDGVYSIWWVDGMVSPSAGPLAPPPGHELRANAEGIVTADIVAAFPLGAHERLVLALHTDGRTEGARAELVGKTIFAHLLGRIPAPRGRAVVSASMTGVRKYSIYGCPQDALGDAKELPVADQCDGLIDIRR
jgi:hypothetical protein